LKLRWVHLNSTCSCGVDVTAVSSTLLATLGWDAMTRTLQSVYSTVDSLGLSPITSCRLFADVQRCALFFRSIVTWVDENLKMAPSLIPTLEISFGSFVGVHDEILWSSLSSVCEPARNIQCKIMQQLSNLLRQLHYNDCSKIDSIQFSYICKVIK